MNLDKRSHAGGALTAAPRRGRHYVNERAIDQWCRRMRACLPLAAVPSKCGLQSLRDRTGLTDTAPLSKHRRTRPRSMNSPRPSASPYVAHSAAKKGDGDCGRIDVDIASEWSETSSNVHLSNLLAMRWNLPALPRGNTKKGNSKVIQSDRADVARNT